MDSTDTGTPEKKKEERPSYLVDTFKVTDENNNVIGIKARHRSHVAKLIRKMAPWMKGKLKIEKAGLDSLKPRPKVSQPKISPNTKCPCGSGRKIKKCCKNLPTAISKLSSRNTQE